MTEPSGVPPLPPDREKIYGIFRRYKFEDALGHPLLNCVEFIQLVNGYCEKRQDKAKEPEA